MSRKWTIQRRREHAKKMRENNPMSNPEVRKNYDLAIAKKTEWYTHSPKTRAKLKKAWTPKRRRKHIRRMYTKVGRLQLAKAQRNGNRLRIGKPNLDAQRWHDSLTDEQRKARAENLSRKMTANFKGRPNKGFVKGKIGYLKTRFGRFRFDSSWERDFIRAANERREVVGLQRDIPVPYLFEGIKRRFLVDFRVEFKRRSPLLVEIKCPYFLDTENTKAKVRAAKQFARKREMVFCLLASKAEAGGAECLDS